MRPRHRVRLAVNLLNGSTLAGLAVARAGRARLAPAPDGLLAGTGYRLPVPPAPAFTLGNVIVTRRDELDELGSPLFRHEARHATQYAWCGGLPMLPLYFAAAAVSWLLSGDFGAWNVFERDAGLADGGYDTATAAAPRRLRFGSLRSGFSSHRGPCEQALHLTSVPVGDEPHLPDGPPALTGQQELARPAERGDPVHDHLRVRVPLAGRPGVHHVGHRPGVQVDPGEAGGPEDVRPDQAARPGEIVQPADAASGCRSAHLDHLPRCERHRVAPH